MIPKKELLWSLYSRWFLLFRVFVSALALEGFHACKLLSPKAYASLQTSKLERGKAHQTR